MNNAMQEIRTQAPVDKDMLLKKSQVLLNNLYDEIILWNMSGDRTPMRKFLGMEPRDYLDFMQDPEKWALGYVARLHKIIQ